jgi:hypothetical protein
MTDTVTLLDKIADIAGIVMTGLLLYGVVGFTIFLIIEHRAKYGKKRPDVH